MVLGHGKRLFGETAKPSALRLVREYRAQRKGAGPAQKDGEWDVVMERGNAWTIIVPAARRLRFASRAQRRRWMAPGEEVRNAPR